MQAAQTCGQIRAGGISSSGRAVLRDHPVVRRARDGNGQAKNKARPWRVGPIERRGRAAFDNDQAGPEF